MSLEETIDSSDHFEYSVGGLETNELTNLQKKLTLEVLLSLLRRGLRDP